MVNIILIGKSNIWKSAFLMQAKNSDISFLCNPHGKLLNAVLINSHGYSKKQIEDILYEYKKIPVFIISPSSIDTNYVVGIFDLNTPFGHIEDTLLSFFTLKKNHQ